MIYSANQKILLSKNTALKPNPPNLAEAYFRLSAGENLILDNKLGVRRWVDSIRNLFFNNTYSRYIPFGFSVNGFYPILDKPWQSTGLIKSFDVNLNSPQFTIILLTKFTKEIFEGSTQEYALPIMNREAIAESSGKITTKGWNIYCINSAIGRNDFKWQFWTGRGFESNGFSIVTGDNCLLDQWEIITCRKTASTSDIFQNGILKNSLNSPNYAINSFTSFLVGANANLENIYFNYALTNHQILDWTTHLKEAYALYI